MRTPLQAMLWELWRTSRFELLLRIVGQSVFILLIFSVTADFSETQIQVIRGIVIILLTATSVFSLTWMKELESGSGQSGFSFRLGFTRPISTTEMVVVPMLYTVIAAVLCFLLPALFFSLLFHVWLPLAVPAAFIATTVACLVAASWSPTTIFGKSLAVSALLIADAVVLFAFERWRDVPDPILLAIGKPEYFQVAWYTYVACLVLSAFAFIVTVFAVERQRHSDRWEVDGVRLAGVARLRNRFRTLPSRAPKPFTGPLAAQCWYEMRRFGNKLLLLGVSFPLLVFVLISAVAWFVPDRDAAPVFSIFAVVACPFVYQLFGADGAIGLRHKQGAARLSAFDATCPLANDQLIAIKLLVIAACSLIGWLCMGLAVGVHAVALGNGQVWARIGEAVSGAAGDVPGYWWAIGLANAVLLYISSTSVLLAFGLWLPLYKMRFLAVAVAVVVSQFLLGWAGDLGWSKWYLWLANCYVMSVAIVVGCAFVLRKALLAGYLGKRLFGGAFCLWVIYVSSTIALYLKLAPGVPIPRAITVLGVSMLLMPLAAAAIAPIALASHRHT